jgi:hypothetical protein
MVMQPLGALPFLENGCNYWREKKNFFALAKGCHCNAFAIGKNG